MVGLIWMVPWARAGGGECSGEGDSTGVMVLLTVGLARAVGLKMMPSMFWWKVPTVWCCRTMGGMFVSAKSARPGVWSSGMLGICLFSGFMTDAVGSEKVRVGTASLLPPAPRQNSSPVLAAIGFEPMPGGSPP